MSAVSHAARACGADATVAACTPVCREHSWIECVLPSFPSSEPGQFVQLLCRDSDLSALSDGRAQTEDRCHSWRDGEFPALSDPDLRGRQAFLRRPFSIADHWTDDDGRAHLLVIARTVGPGTAWLEHLRRGDTLSVTGPLGRGFRMPAADVPCVLVGGGVGIPPLLYVSRRLAERGQRDVTLVVGTRNRELLPVRLIGEPAADGRPTVCTEYPGGVAVKTVVASDDGSVGVAGTVIAGLDCWRVGRNDPRGAVVLACGPEGMLRGIAAWTRQHRLACQLCIERNMGCGLGTCLSCVVRVRAPDRADGWRWVLSCQDGPVFDRDELLDYASDGSA